MKTFNLVYSLPDEDQAGVEYLHSTFVNATSEEEAKKLTIDQFFKDEMFVDESYEEVLEILETGLHIIHELPVLIEDLETIITSNFD